MSTPIVDLTKSTNTWQNNACLNPYGNYSWAYIHGFKQLAEMGTDYVMQEHMDQDTLVFPILFNYRHYIELQCKRIIGMYRWANDLDDVHVTGHKLSVLWPLTRPIVLEVNNGHDNDPEVIHADQLIAQIEAWDDGGTAFRYTRDLRTNSNSLPGLTYIGIDTVRIEMDKLISVLDATDNQLGIWLDTMDKGWH